MPFRVTVTDADGFESDSYWTNNRDDATYAARVFAGSAPILSTVEIRKYDNGRTIATVSGEGRS